MLRLVTRPRRNYGSSEIDRFDVREFLFDDRESILVRGGQVEFFLKLEFPEAQK